MKRTTNRLIIKRRRKKLIKRIITFSILILIVGTFVAIKTNLKLSKLESLLATNIIDSESKSDIIPTDDTSSDNSNPNKDENSSNTVPTDPFEGLTLINDNRGVPVLCYHSIGDDPTGKNPIIISKEKLRQDLQTIKNLGYTTLTLSQLNDYIFNDKAIPEKSVVITFDDGYKDNYTNAFPILKELNLNATIFVISSYLDRQTYLSPEEVKEMSDYGIDIQSHTVNHVRLTDLSYAEQLKELKDSKDQLEKLTGKPVNSIAYPEGFYNDDTKKAFSDSGYSMGFTIKRGYADRDDKSFELNRICIDYTYKPTDIENVLKNLPK